jgi:hypothetical protein
MNRDDGTVLERYASALSTAAPENATQLMTEDAVLVSPFSVWANRDDIEAAYAARSLAVTDIEVLDTIRESGSGVLVWRGRVGDQVIEGCDVVTVTAAGHMSHVDIYVRPASVLEPLRLAMRNAWPTGAAASTRSGT